MDKIVLNTPTYRALIKYEENKYIEGFLTKSPKDKRDERSEDLYYIENEDYTKELIDITTLSINFPDMTDSQDTPIFASLNPNGKGGDIYQYWNDPDHRPIYTIVYNSEYNAFALMHGDNHNEWLSEINFEDYELIGIQE